MSVLRQGLIRHFAPDELSCLGEARIGIAGAGGLGSNVAMLLVRSGIRHLTIVDRDVVEPSNLNRQFYWPEDVGMPKVEALRRRLLRLEPELDCRYLHGELTPESAPALFADCRVVVEALDGAASKARLCSALLAGGFTVVAASGLAGYGLAPMRVRRLGPSFICVGDFASDADAGLPTLAPRVTQAAALQADVVLSVLLSRVE
jgi:sulfur carrier protein ThiS adenylyltransferase